MLEYDNDFPALSQTPPEPDDVANDFFKVAPAYGKCEVILYSPEHTKTLKELPQSHVEKLVGLWCERFDALRADEKIKFVFIFENREIVVILQHLIIRYLSAAGAERTPVFGHLGTILPVRCYHHPIIDQGIPSKLSHIQDSSFHRNSVCPVEAEEPKEEAAEVEVEETAEDKGEE